MFKCQNCNQIVPAHSPNIKVVTARREKSYSNVSERDGVKDTKGWEIVKEISVGPCCAEKLTGVASFIPSLTLAEVNTKPFRAVEEKKPFIRHDSPRRNQSSSNKPVFIRKDTVVEYVNKRK